MADGMTRSNFLRAYRCQLQLFLVMEVATKVDMAVQNQETPLSKDVEALMQSSVVGAELFATEARKEETRAYARKTDERIYNLEMECKK